jgi:hypothetical protein
MIVTEMLRVTFFRFLTHGFEISLKIRKRIPGVAAMIGVAPEGEKIGLRWNEPNTQWQCISFFNASS